MAEAAGVPVEDLTPEELNEYLQEIIDSVTAEAATCYLMANSVAEGGLDNYDIAENFLRIADCLESLLAYMTGKEEWDYYYPKITRDTMPKGANTGIHFGRRSFHGIFNEPPNYDNDAMHPREIVHIEDYKPGAIIKTLDGQLIEIKEGMEPSICLHGSREDSFVNMYLKDGGEYNLGTFYGIHWTEIGFFHKLADAIRAGEMYEIPAPPTNEAGKG